MGTGENNVGKFEKDTLENQTGNKQYIKNMERLTLNKMTETAQHKKTAVSGRQDRYTSRTL